MDEDVSVARSEHALTVAQKVIPMTTAMLKADYLWITDTGASGHCTGHKAGGSNIRNGSMATTGVSGKAIKLTNKMDLGMGHCDKYGNEISWVTFTDVSYLESANYNLCSLS